MSERRSTFLKNKNMSHMEKSSTNSSRFRTAGNGLAPLSNNNICKEET